jgi:hypothetical protein
MYALSTYQLFPDLAAQATARTFSQCRREPDFPVADRLVTEHDAAHQEHLRQVAQAEFVAQPPKHHERDNVLHKDGGLGRVLGFLR